MRSLILSFFIISLVLGIMGQEQGQAHAQRYGASGTIKHQRMKKDFTPLERFETHTPSQSLSDRMSQDQSADNNIIEKNTRKKIYKRNKKHFNHRYNNKDFSTSSPGYHGRLNAQKRQELRTQMKKMSPQERKQLLKNLQQQHRNITKEQRQHRKERFEQQWNESTPAGKQQICDNVQRICSGNSASHACLIARQFCAP